jgi:hypothetical protein
MREEGKLRINADERGYDMNVRKDNGRRPGKDRQEKKVNWL